MILRVSLWLALVLSAGLGLYGMRPPAALGPKTAADQFSARRAIAHLPHFATRPHPTGSEANDRTREYLVATLRALGAEVRIEKTTGRHTRGKRVWEGEAQNIVATLPGTDNHRAVMLAAHYDSVPTGPGAADDGAGVTSILEALRAVRAGPPLANDLLILLTDGEEAGLLGAAGFVADHPDLSSRVGIVMNLEARGSSGPALMFETSDQNGWLIPEFARAAPYPMASSLMYSFYKLMPNDTDLTELKKSGVGALNFAFTETVKNYHSAHDTVANLDPRSVQQMGANTLALARHFGRLPLSEARKPGCIYFNWLGARLLFYPVWGAWLLAAVTVVLLVVAYLRGARDGLKVSLASLGAFFLLLLLVGGGMLAAWSAINFAAGGSLGQDDGPTNQLCFAGLVALGLVIGGIMLGWLSRKLGVQTLCGGLLIATTLLAVLVLCLLPGASYVLQWPALLGVGSWLLGLRAPGPAVRAGCALLAAFPTVILFAPLAYLFFANLGLNLVCLGAVALLLSFLLATGWPLFDFLIRDENCRAGAPPAPDLGNRSGRPPRRRS